MANLDPAGRTPDVADGAPRVSKGKDFVLVHGAWHGGWCYARVAEILRARGHRVFTPTLTGVGERSHLAGLGVINCSTHIQDIVNVIHWEQLNDVVLCGHSYGGLVVGAVADRIPDRIASLVYLDAAIPENGKSLFDLNNMPELNAAVLNATAAFGGHMTPPFPAAAMGINAADESMVDALCTPHPLASFCERIALTGAHTRIAMKAYVLATGWQGSPNHAHHARVKDDKGWATFEIPCGHDVMLDAPERLAEILLEVM